MSMLSSLRILVLSYGFFGFVVRRGGVSSVSSSITSMFRAMWGGSIGGFVSVMSTEIWTDFLAGLCGELSLLGDGVVFLERRLGLTSCHSVSGGVV